MVVWLRIPFGNICTFQNGSLTVVVNKQLLVIISGGQSRDALPLAFVSPELVCKIAIEMETRGYQVDLSQFPQDLVSQLRRPGAAARVTA